MSTDPVSTDPVSTDPASTSDTAPAQTSSTPALSKSAQKRLAKSERFAQLKLERRAREKEEKALKRKEREERLAAGEDVGPSDSKKRRVSRGGEGPVQPFNARIVIDLGFDEKMTDKEVGSLCSQLAYTYASHRRTRTPFTGLLITSLNGRALTHMDGINDGSYRRWKGVEWWSEDIDGLWNTPLDAEQETQHTGAEDPAVADAQVDEAPEQKPTDPEAPVVEPTSTGPAASDVPPARGKPRRSRKQAAPQVRASCSRESIVYLTADAEDELLELQEGETYIIGGIVDRNRYKNLCANKARDLNVRTARLPIGRYLADMPTRKVLTVFDILVYWVNTRDWEQAMQKVMPKRKFNANGKKGKGSKAPTSEADEDTEAEDEGEGDLDNKHAQVVVDTSEFTLVDS
ncbi:tRNA (guanine-N(1))-methyltransferase [Ceratobasidium sp. AG-Ba]|nr:tRNA (guanine-N(1))-methyltransferase [Ceratobasidium sp. AG-Ba]